MAEEHPGKAQKGQMRSRVFKSHPNWWRDEEGWEPGCFAYHAQPEPPYAEVQRKIEDLKEEIVNQIVPSNGPDPVEQAGREEDTGQMGEDEGFCA